MVPNAFKVLQFIVLLKNKEGDPIQNERNKGKYVFKCFLFVILWVWFFFFLIEKTIYLGADTIIQMETDRHYVSLFFVWIPLEVKVSLRNATIYCSLQIRIQYWAVSGNVFPDPSYIDFYSATQPSTFLGFKTRTILMFSTSWFKGVVKFIFRYSRDD